MKGYTAYSRSGTVLELPRIMMPEAGGASQDESAASINSFQTPLTGVFSIIAAFMTIYKSILPPICHRGVHE
jgi:hypothetical protein